MSTYDEILASRPDMTEWLIHFTRDNNGKLAREILLKILIEGVLRPGFSVRGNQRTVYGTMRAVCFTEQPLLSFAKYVDARKESWLTDGYGIVLHKHDVHLAGGRPVIYGLENELPEVDDYTKAIRGLPNKCRLLPIQCLPENEQYRYVRFIPKRIKSIDWSHEREWRWPEKAKHAEGNEVYLLGGRYGQFLARMHVIVKYENDIIWLQQELAKALKQNLVGNLSLQNLPKPYLPEWEKVLYRSKIISLEDVKNNNILRFDDIEEINMNSLLI